MRLGFGLGLNRLRSIISSTFVGITYWLKNSGYYFTNPLGNIVAVNGDPVANWTDSLLAKPFTQATLGKRPTLNTSLINSKPALSFDGIDDDLSCSGDFIASGGRTFYAVIKPTSWGGSSQGNIIDNTKFCIRVSAAARIVVFSNKDAESTTFASTPNSSLVLGTSYVIAVTRATGGAVNIYINGVLSGSANQPSGTPASGGNVHIGNNASGANSFGGGIGDIAISTTSVHDAATVLANSNILRAKYGI
jgi:hypothetical protein